MSQSGAIPNDVAEVLNSSSVFGDLLSPDQLNMLLTNSLLRPVEVNEVLCQQAMTSRSMFLIINGEFRVSIETKDRHLTLATRGKGDLIGEISALFMMQHIATVSATQSALVLEIPSEIFITILADNTDLHNIVLRRSKSRIIETALRHTPVFCDLSQSDFDELCYVSSMVTANKGDIIIRETDIDYSMYVICTGAVRVFTDINGVDVTVALRRAGEFFGEYSYLTGQPRTASVSALTDIQLIKLEGEAFQSFMEYNESTESSIRQAADERKTSLDKLRDKINEKSIALQRLKKIQELNEAD